MKSEKEIREKLRKARQLKSNCKCKGYDTGFRINLKVVQLLEWILE